MKALILGSTSPRRHQLLQKTGLTFAIARPDIDETPYKDEPAADYVFRLSREKAEAVAAQGHAGLILTADTTVADTGGIIGKPDDANHAAQILMRLRGRLHHVLSGVTLLDSTTRVYSTQVITTEVHMRDYSNAEIAEYITSGDPFGKAGSYAIQSLSFHPVDGLNGCYTNVVGLPLCAVRNLFAQYGIALKIPYCSSENLPCQFSVEE